MAIIFGSWGRGETKRLCGRIFVHGKNTGKFTAGTWKNHPIKKENHLKQISMTLGSSRFQGCTPAYRAFKQVPLLAAGVQAWNIGTVSSQKKRTGRTHIHPWSLTWNLNKNQPLEKGDPFWKPSLSGSLFNFVGVSPEHWYKMIQVAGRCQVHNSW